jgi:hypothetical protein
MDMWIGVGLAKYIVALYRGWRMKVFGRFWAFGKGFLKIIFSRAGRWGSLAIRAG